MTALTTACNEIARLDNHQVARYVLDHLGPTLTDYIADVRSRAMARRWGLEPKEHGATEPSIAHARRLRTARNWLISTNPRLDDRTPAELIRADHAPALFRAADAFIADHTNAYSCPSRSMCSEHFWGYGSREGAVMAHSHSLTAT